MATQRWFRFLSGWVVFGVVCVMAFPVHATNGYFSHGYGATNKALAGAGVAFSQDTMATAVNPAGMATLGHRFDLGLAFLNPKRGFGANDDAQSPPFASVPAGWYLSDEELFLIPHIGYNKPLDANSSIGVSIGGNGGMLVHYDDNVFRNFDGSGLFPASSPTSTQLEQLFFGISYARKVHPDHVVGIAPILAVQRLEVKGLEPFMPVSLHPDHVTNKGMDYSTGAGLSVGWQGQMTPWLRLGAAYRSRLYMSKFDKYKGLLAEEGDYDIPATYTLGLAAKPHPDWTVFLDMQEILYGDIKALSNGNDQMMMPGNLYLGTRDGMGFGWQDQTVIKLGLQWQARPDLTLRTGFSVADQVVPGTQGLFNILAPAVVRKHWTFGFSKEMSPHQTVNLAFMHAFEERVNGTNPNTGPQTGYLEMEQNEVEISWSYQF